MAAALVAEEEDEGEADADSGSCRMAASERALIHWIMDATDAPFRDLPAPVATCRVVLQFLLPHRLRHRPLVKYKQRNYETNET